uniref:PHD finger protein 11 n=1 Tax=Spermophilus dauricus TaxID=99837 RepID=A0A8C9UTJ6_SPEDA
MCPDDEILLFHFSPGMLLIGIFQVAEKMEKRTCALCPKDLEYSVLYFAQSENIAAHECCLLYSSALVECEDHDPHNCDRNFDVESVKKEIQRGRKLKCTLCRERGATVGCDLKTCAKNYHFFCARKDNAFPQADGARGIYKVLCQHHAPRSPTNAQSDAIVKTPFLKKCKEAGLLNDLFEEILDKLHLIQERLMDETTSESGTKFPSTETFHRPRPIENKIHESEEMRQQLKEDIELLQDLKQTLCSFQENRDLRSSSTSESSLSS